MAIRIMGVDPALANDIVGDILATTGREVVFSCVTSVDVCPVCSGNDPFCGTCFGNRTIQVTNEVKKTASVRWKTGEKKIFRPEGQYIDGDCLLVIHQPDDSASLDVLLNSAKSVVVDNRLCVIASWYYRGSPNINRVYVVVKEDDQIEDHRIG